MVAPALPPIFEVENNPIAALPKAKAWVQPGPPFTTTGFKRGQQWCDSDSGKLYELTLVGSTLTWTEVANLKGPQGEAGEGTLSPEALDDVIETVSTAVQPTVDLIAIFEAALED